MRKPIYGELINDTVLYIVDNYLIYVTKYKNINELMRFFFSFILWTTIFYL